MKMRDLLMALCAAFLLTLACGKSETEGASGGAAGEATQTGTAETATETTAAPKPVDPPASDPQGDEAGEAGEEAAEGEPLPTPEDFEEEAAAAITEKNLEKAVSDLEKALEDEE